MKKLFLGVVLSVLFVAQSAFAMTFSQPVKIGIVGVGNPNGGVEIKGATKVDATSSGTANWYKRGTAVFDDKLYFHFDHDTFSKNIRQSRNWEKAYEQTSRFGDSDIKNTVTVFVFEGATKISRLNNNKALEMYVFETETGGGGSTCVIGKRDGKWVKFFNTIGTRQNYGVNRSFYRKKFFIDGDTLVFRYEHWQTKEQRDLRFKWDEAAQWFGVEQVVY